MELSQEIIMEAVAIIKTRMKELKICDSDIRDQLYLISREVKKLSKE